MGIDWVHGIRRGSWCPVTRRQTNNNFDEARRGSGGVQRPKVGARRGPLRRQHRQAATA